MKYSVYYLILVFILISSCKKDKSSGCDLTDYEVLDNTSFILYKLNWQGEEIESPYCVNCMEVNATFGEEDDQYEIYYNIWRTNELNEVDTINFTETGTYSYTFCNKSPGRISGVLTTGNIFFKPSIGTDYTAEYSYQGGLGLSIDELRIDGEFHFITIWPQ